MILDARDITVKVGDKVSIIADKFFLKKFEIILIEGENGSGKSSFFKGLMGCSGAYLSGEIQFEKKDIKNFSLDQKSKEGILYIPQHTPSIQGLTMLKILYGQYQFKEQESIIEFKRKLENIIPGYLLANNLLTKPLEALSGGEKKKVEIISIIALRPKLVFLDEVDSGVDEETTRLFANEVNRLSAEGLSFAIVSHSKDFKKMLNVKRRYTIKNFILKENNE